MADTTNKKYKLKYHLLIINHAKYSVYKLLIDYNKADKNKPAANSHFLRTAGPYFPDSPGHIKRTAWDISRAEGTPPY